jgi:LysM repeat protein
VEFLFTAHPATAEWFIDVYGGVGLVEKNDVSIEKDTTGEGLSVSSISVTLQEVEVDEFATGGLRAGYWFTGFRPLGLNFGLGFDAFLFQLQMSSQTVKSDSNVDVTLQIGDEEVTIRAGDNRSTRLPAMDTLLSVVMSAELMLRRPFLTSAHYPHGRVQPYVTLAPALLFTDEDLSASIGLKAGAGLAWQWHRAFALFAEYRFTHFELEYDDTAVVVEGVTSSNPKVEFDLTSHYLLAGLRVDLSALFAPRKRRTPRSNRAVAPPSPRRHNVAPAPTTPRATQPPRLRPIQKRATPVKQTPTPVQRYTVRRGDTLWGIAAQRQIYQDPYMWPLLYRANRYQIYDPDLIYPQQIFTIPRDVVQEETDAATQRARQRGPWRLGDGPDVYILEGIRRR